MTPKTRGELRGKRCCHRRNLTFFIPQNTRAHYSCPVPKCPSSALPRGKSNDFRFFCQRPSFWGQLALFSLTFTGQKTWKCCCLRLWESSVLVAFSHVSLASKAQKSSIFSSISEAFCLWYISRYRVRIKFRFSSIVWWYYTFLDHPVEGLKCKLKENAFVLVCCNLHLSCVVLLVTRCYCIVHQRPLSSHSLDTTRGLGICKSIF